MPLASLLATTALVLSWAGAAMAADCATTATNLATACEFEAQAAKAVLGSAFDLEEAEDECDAITAARRQACTALGNAEYTFLLRASDFQTAVTNPYLPMPLGRKLTYKEGAATVVIEVLRPRRSLNGIPVTVVRDRSSEGGETQEDTLDFFAQKKDGTVVYLGENTAEFESNVQANTAGSFLGGFESGFGYGPAMAGTVMPANPKLPKSYRIEFDAGNAEDWARTDGSCGTVVTPAGTFTDTIRTRERVPLEPDVEETKCYARGVGMVRATNNEGGIEILTKIEG